MVDHSVLEIVHEFGIPRSIESRVCRDYSIDAISTRIIWRMVRPHAINERVFGYEILWKTDGDKQPFLKCFVKSILKEAVISCAVAHLSANTTHVRWCKVQSCTIAVTSSHCSTTGRHHDWMLDQYHWVAWSDKSSFQLFQADIHIRVWCTPHEAIYPSCLHGTVQAEAYLWWFGVCLHPQN